MTTNTTSNTANKKPKKKAGDPKITYQPDKPLETPQERAKRLQQESQQSDADILAAQQKAVVQQQLEAKEQELKKLIDEEIDNKFQPFGIDLILQNPPPIKYLIDGFLPENNLMIFCGQFGSCKTWIALLIAMSVAGGFKFLGHKATKSPIAIFDAEGGKMRAWRRLNRVAQGLQADGLLKDPLKELNNQLHIFTNTGLNLKLNPDLHEKVLTKLIERTNSRVAIIDSLSAISAGADENSVSEMLPIIASLRRVMDTTSAAIIPIHHTNKAGGFRGSSALADQSDTFIMVSAEKLKDDPNKSYVKFKVIKDRDSIFPDPNFAAMIEFENAADNTGAADTVRIRQAQYIDDSDKLTGLAQDIVDYLKSINSKQNPVYMNDITDYGIANLNSTYNSIRGTVTRLINKGIVKTTGKTGQGNKPKYYID